MDEIKQFVEGLSQEREQHYVADIDRLSKEVERLKKKYEERCWCSVSTPSLCGHKSNL
jgi:hypothetical protein